MECLLYYVLFLPSITNLKKRFERYSHTVSFSYLITECVLDKSSLAILACDFKGLYPIM
jgi:hypothetical protein